MNHINVYKMKWNETYILKIIKKYYKFNNYNYITNLYFK